jgi:hypothetical protein
VAKKAPKRSTTMKSKKPAKAAARAAAKPPAKPAAKATTRSKPTATARPAVATARPGPQPAGPSLLEQAERLRDEIQRSKLTHPDPWTYGVKARTWGVRAQALVDQLAAQGDDTATRRALVTLEAEVQGSRDFQEARRLF